MRIDQNRLSFLGLSVSTVSAVVLIIMHAKWTHIHAVLNVIVHFKKSKHSKPPTGY